MVHATIPSCQRLQSDRQADRATERCRLHGGRLQQWVVGVGLATLTVGWGLWGVISQHTYMLNVGPRGMRRAGGLFRELFATDAVFLSCFFLALGLFLHVQWYWGNSENLESFYGWYDLAKHVLLLAIVVLFVIAFVSSFSLI